MQKWRVEVHLFPFVLCAPSCDESESDTDDNCPQPFGEHIICCRYFDDLSDAGKFVRLAKRFGIYEERESVTGSPHQHYPPHVVMGAFVVDNNKFPVLSRAQGKER